MFLQFDFWEMFNLTKIHSFRFFQIFVYIGYLRNNLRDITQPSTG